MPGWEVLVGGERATFSGVDEAEGVLFPFGADGEELTRGVETEVGNRCGQVHH